MKNLINFFRYGSRTSGDDGTARGRQAVDAMDAMAAVTSHRSIDGDSDNVALGGGMPPGYVKAYDEGRPRK
jgi:hypothetical protein